jgi:hypothetical protein
VLAAVCSNAVTEGHLALLQWARANGCDWTDFVTSYAAQAGQLHILKWAVENGCACTDTTCCHAEEGGDLKTLEWLAQRGCDRCREAAERLKERHRKELEEHRLGV